MPKNAEASNKGFVFGDSKETGPNKVLQVLPVEAYLAQYTDGASKACVRLIFKVPGVKEVFILQERIQGSFVATTGTPWFNEAFTQKLNEKDLEPKATDKKKGAEGAEAI